MDCVSGTRPTNNISIEFDIWWKIAVPLQWRLNGRDSVSNHQPHDCLLNRLFRRRSKKSSKLRVIGLCVGNSLGTGEFPAQMASNAENVSIWWRHHVLDWRVQHFVVIGRICYEQERYKISQSQITDGVQGSQFILWYVRPIHIKIYHPVWPLPKRPDQDSTFYINIHQPYTSRDATLADQRTCVYRYRQLIFTHCEHNVSQEHLLKPRDYHQLAPPVQFDNQLASSLYSVGFILPGSRSTVGFITRDFHALISQQHSQTNRRGLYTLFLASKSRCMQKNQLCRCPTYRTKRAVLIRSLRQRPYRMKPTAVGFISLTTLNVHLSSVRFWDIHLRSIPQEMHKIFDLDMTFK